MMRFDLPTVSALVRHHQELQGLGAYAATIEIVPNLSHDGKLAWATVDTDTDAKTADIKVLDLAKTPPAGFKGDLWRELEITLAHEFGHVAFAEYEKQKAKDPLAAEETLVERFARAIMRAPLQAARAIQRAARQVLPNAIRARVVARTSARGGDMDAKAVLAAIKDQDEAAALTILEGWLAEQIGSAAGPGSAAPPAPKLVEPGAMPPPEDEAMRLARRAREATMTKEDSALRARQVAATESIEAAAKSAVADAIETKITRAREVDGFAILPEDERDLRACTDVASAEKLLGVMRRHAGETKKRARSVDASGAPIITAPVVTGEAELLNGLQPQEIKMYHDFKARDVDAAKAYATEAQKIRARRVEGVNS